MSYLICIIVLIKSFLWNLKWKHVCATHHSQNMNIVIISHPVFLHTQTAYMDEKVFSRGICKYSSNKIDRIGTIQTRKQCQTGHYKLTTYVWLHGFAPKKLNMLKNIYVDMSKICSLLQLEGCSHHSIYNSKDSSDISLNIRLAFCHQFWVASV